MKKWAVFWWTVAVILTCAMGWTNAMAAAPKVVAGSNAVPSIAFTAFLSGTGDEKAYDLALDSKGFIYLVGKTSSKQLPHYSHLQSENHGGFDAFVAKFSPVGQLLFCSFLGGSGDDSAYHVVVDAWNNIIVVGTTSSVDFPVSKPSQGYFGGGQRDGFIAKISPDGTRLVYSTYFGGTGNDDIANVALDLVGNVYVAGGSSSTNLPSLGLHAISNHKGTNAFVARFDVRGSIQYCSTFGGSVPYNCAIGLAVDPAGYVFLTGYTGSPDFPTKNAWQPQHHGGYDAFVIKLDPTGTNMLFSTFLGGSGDDYGRSITIDVIGNVVVSGDTMSSDFPTVNSVQPNRIGVRNVFVSRLSFTGTELVNSTLFGGGGEDLAGLAGDSEGHVWLAGLTTSTNMPTRNAFQPAFGGGTWD
jgi:hypothetical protein